MNQINQLLTLNPEKRTNQHIKEIKTYLRKTLFFEHLYSKTNQKLFNIVIDGFAKQGQYEMFQQGTLALRQGERIDRFLMLLDGSALKLVPKTPEEIQNQKLQLLTQFPHLAEQIEQLVLPLTIHQTSEGRLQVKYMRHRTTSMNSSQRMRTTVRVVKEVNISDDVFDSLSEEVDIAFRSTQLNNDFWMSHLFDGFIFRFKLHSSFQAGECLNTAIENKKQDCSVFAQSDLSVLALTIKQFEDMMKSIELAKTSKLIGILYIAFDVDDKDTEFKSLLKELIRHTTKRKLCSQQVLYREGQQSNYLYAVIKGEFKLVKEYEYTLTINEPRKRQNSQYEQFKQLVQQQQEQAQHQEQKKRRSRTKHTEESLKEDKQQDDVGPANYKLIQELKKVSKSQETLRKANKLTWEFNLAQIGLNQLIGEEDFNYNYLSSQYHTYRCICISSSAKVIQIKKSDVYRICQLFDHISQSFHMRCQNKREWLEQRFQNLLEKELREIRNQQNPPKQAEVKKSEDQKVLDKFRKFQREQLNLIKLDPSLDKQKYEKSLRCLLAKKGITVVDKVKGSSPTKQLTPLVEPNPEYSIRHRAALKIKESQLSKNEDTDIGILSYMLQMDKKQLRLLHHTLNKNRRKNEQVELQNGSPVPKTLKHYRPQTFTSFNTLLNHVTVQHFEKLNQECQEQEEMKQLPVRVRGIVSSRTFHRSTSNNSRIRLKSMASQQIPQNSTQRNMSQNTIIF